MILGDGTPSIRAFSMPVGSQLNFRLFDKCSKKAKEKDFVQPSNFVLILKTCKEIG